MSEQCNHKARGNQCEKPSEPEHRLHRWEVNGKFYMWEDASTYKRGAKPYPKIGDNLRDFPEYGGTSGEDGVASGYESIS